MPNSIDMQQLNAPFGIVLCFKLDSVSKKVHFSPPIQTDARESHLQSRPRQFTSGNIYALHS